jgi:hypothetical protein
MSTWSVLILAVLTLQPTRLPVTETRRAVQTGLGEVTLAWQAQTGVRMYQILVDNGGGIRPVATIPGDRTSYVWRARPGAEARATGDTLTFWIEPTDPLGKSSGPRLAFNPVRLEPVQPPDNRRAVQTGRDEVTLTWDARAHVPMYRILADEGKGPRTIGTIGGNGTRYVARLKPDPKAIDRKVIFSIGPADRTGREAGTTATFNPITIEQVPTGRMYPPRHVSAALTGDTITVKWDAVEGAKGYAIMRSAGGSGFKTICEMCPTDTQYVDRDLVKGARHSYAVIAITLQGRSPAARSDDVDTKSLVPAAGPGSSTLAPPANARATLIGKEVELTWSAVPGAFGYVIHLDRIPVGRTGANTTRFRHTPGHPGRLQYDVAATDGKRSSDLSRFNEVTIEGGKTGGGTTPPGGTPPGGTPPGGTAPPGDAGGPPPGPVGKRPDADAATEVSPPTNLKAVLSGTTVQLSWTAPPGVRGYQIRRNGRMAISLGKTATSWSEAVGHLAGEQLRYEIVALGSGRASEPAAFNAVTVPRTTIPKH